MKITTPKIYHWLHIPTGKTGTTEWKDRETDGYIIENYRAVTWLEALNIWNAASDQWKYWVSASDPHEYR